MSDEYPDLPGWITPGAKLAALGLDSATMVTVTKITQTQIVTVADSNKSAVLRFRREECKEIGGSAWVRELIGNRLVVLERRDHTRVVQFKIRGVIQGLAQDVRSAVTPKFVKDDRTEDERAMAILDDLENLVRRARKKVERLLDPAGMLAAEHAQELEPTEP